MNAATPFLDNFAKYSDKTAVVEPKGRSVTYSDLHKRVVGLYHHLKKLGMNPGDRVILQVPGGVDFAATAIAVLLLGGVPVLIEPGLGDEVYLSRVKACTPKWLLVHPLLITLGKIPGARGLLRKRELDVPPVPPLEGGMQKVIINDKFVSKLAQGADLNAAMEVADRADDDDGIMVFTGGTTSMPKGVRLSHHALGYYISHISSAVADLTLENYLADTPQQVLYALRLGKTAYITKGRKQKRAAYVFSLIQAKAIDAYFGSPYVWTEMMAQAGGSKTQLPDSLKSVMLGGAPVTPEFLESLKGWLSPATQVLALYGMTEAGPICAVSAENKLAYNCEGDLVGAPLEGIRIEIVDPDPETDIGDVVVHSPSLYSGYLGKQPRDLEAGLETGDLGKLIDVDGKQMLVLMGRKKDMIIRDAVNIYPASFEPAIRSYTEQGTRPVRECAMIGLWNETRQDEDVVCCLQPAAGMELNLAKIKKWAEKVCGTDAKPDHYLIVDPIPVTGRQNKVDKQGLRMFAAGKLGLKVKKELA